MLIEANEFNSLDEAILVSRQASCSCKRGLKVNQILGRFFVACIKNPRHHGILISEG